MAEPVGARASVAPHTPERRRPSRDRPAAHGAGLPEVARSLGPGVATARTHAQRVFSKAGVRGQAELARHVERLGLRRSEHAE